MSEPWVRRLEMGWGELDGLQHRAERFIYQEHMFSNVLSGC
jgi:hypothetical protein